MKLRIRFLRYYRRLVYVFFLLLVTLPPELPLLLPPPVAAAGIAGNEARGSDPQVEHEAEQMEVTIEPADTQTNAAGVEATHARAAAPAKRGPDLSPAYIESVDLGNGERGVLLSSDPVKYLAPDGEWKAIDPRFTQQVDGFYNLTNIMTIKTEARQAVLQVSHSELDARWAPHALVLADGEREVVLAKPRPTQAVQGMLSDDGRTVSYPGSWTMAGMADEIVAGAGEVEHNVLFEQAPSLNGETPGDGARLILRARLELPPGGQLWVEGVQQTGPFTTTNTIELRNYAGTTTLNLTPALVFEVARPDRKLVATYHVKPVNLRSWEISMETPLSWWVDPARQYPVVWDPMMQVLRAIDVAQIYQNPACASLMTELSWAAGVGRATCYTGSAVHFSPVRTLIRFNQINQLNLPPQAEIQGAVLLVAPYDGIINYTSYGEFHPCVNTRVHPVTSAWNPATVSWNNQPSIGAAFLSNSTSYQGRNDPPICFRPEPYSTRNSGVKYLLQNGPTGIVTNWINGGTNHGLELRATEAEENGCDPRYGCDFVWMPKRSVWSSADRNLFFTNDFEAMEGAGFMLLVRYKGPTLVNNVPFKYDNPVPIPPKFEDQNFHRTRHVYTLPARPASNPQWLVVGSKAFLTEFNYLGVAKQGLFSYPYWKQNGETLTFAAQSDEVGPAAANASHAQAYAFPMAVATESCTSPSCEARSNGGGNLDGSNFLLLNANSAQGREVRIDPLAPDPDLEQYAVEAAWSKEMPAVTAEQVGETGFRYEFSATIGSEHIVQVYNLSLPENVHVSLSTTMTVQGLYWPTAQIVTHLFPPGGGIYPKTMRHETAAQNNAVRKKAIRTYIPPGGGGNHAVVLELTGDKTAFDECYRLSEGCYADTDEFDEEPKDRTLLVTIGVQVCPANSIPTDTGCALVPVPDPNAPNLWQTVGPYRIFSQAGFENCSGNLVCSRRYAGGKEYATIITWGGELKRVAIMAGNSIPSYENYVALMRDSATPTERRLTGSSIFALGRYDSGTEIMPRFEINEEYMEVDFAGGQETYFEGSCYIESCHALALGDYDRANFYDRYPDVYTCCATVRVYMPQSADDSTSQYAEIDTRLIRTLATTVGTETQEFRLKWQVKAEGYRGWSDSPSGTGPLNVQVTPQNTVNPAPVAGLTYHFSTDWEAYFDEAEGYFTQFRNNSGYILQPAELGGAWNYVDYVVLPFGESPGGGSGLAMCPGFCGDVRAPDDTWAAPKPQWKMPDILVNQLPNTVMVSSPGSLQVYSTDHPTSIGATNETLGFSFKTFGAQVELTDGVCPDGSSSQPVPLIRGTTSLSLPGLDPNANPQQSNSAIPNIKATFVLCENALRQVSITFQYPPGIPVAAPPVLYVDMIGGTVTIGPQDVVITVDVSYYIGTGVPQIMKGEATLTLDTRGLFDLQATGRVMGVMDAQGHLWVAWNPLDMGVGVQGWLPDKNDWVLTGFVYAHVWRGSGWQNKYPWLAGNDDFHLTSSLQAQFKISEGAVVDEWPLVIPPGDILIGVELSFGQFCDNDACTEYEWGIKGKITIIGFDVGVYVSLECPPLLAAVVFPPAVLLCTSFILGSDDHLLIDQYGGNGPPFPLAAAEMDGAESGMVRDARLSTANRIVAADPHASEVDHVLTVKESAASILVGFGWVRGNPNVALVKPGGEVITAANAASMGAVVSTTANSVIFGIQDPPAGQWIARLTNVTETDDYHVMYFANKVTPGVTFTAPTGLVNINAEGDSTGTQSYKIRWTPPPNAAQLSMSLFYSATVLNPTSDTYQYGGVIRENIDPSAGEYDWDLTHLSSGDYRIYATLQDKKGAQVSELGTDQYVGISTSIAPGTLRYLDKIAPPAPNVDSITITDTEDGVNVCWDVNPAHDLSEYQITYTVHDIVRFFGQTITERMPAVVSFGPGARQCMRIGGLISGASLITFEGGGLAAVDASGNVSGLAVPPEYWPQATGATHVGPEPPTLSGTVSGGNANLSWDSDPAATKYELFYAREAFAGPHQPGTGASAGNSPLTINGPGFGGSYAVTGLPRGYWYAFAVREFGPNPEAPPSLLSNQLWLLITNGVDSNGDGCPDDWEAAHQPYNGNANPDGDGLTTAQECQYGTNPNVPDSDGDGTTDGVEVQEGSDPRNPLSVPELNADAAPPLPAVLAVGDTRLSFVAYTQGPNPPAQNVPFSNLGNGSFTVNVTDNRPWLAASVNGSNIVVNVDKSGLTPGSYEGAVQVSADPGTTLGSPQVIQVNLIVVAAPRPTAEPPGPQPNQPKPPLYLPNVRR